MALIPLADATAIMFTRLLFAAAVGFALFGERPGIWTWAGGTLIFAASVFIARRG